MTSPFSDELISAYLDGELTAQEREYVEAQLREHADLRRMCDELRALRWTLQAMPVAEPPENLAERVMRQAERRMLAGDPEPVDIPDAVKVIPPKAARHVLHDWRVTVGVVGVLAASVLVLIWLPQYATQDVALAPATAPRSAAAPDHARSDDRLAESAQAASALAEPADEIANFGMQTQDSRAPEESRPLARRAAGLAPAVPAAPPALAEGAGADDLKNDSPALSAQPEMPGAGGTAGMGGMGGMPGFGQPAAGQDGAMDPGSTRLGGGYGGAEPPAANAARPDALMGPGMGAVVNSGASAAGGQGVAKGMTPHSMSPGSGMPAVVPPSDSATTAETDTPKEEKTTTENIPFARTAPENEQLIGRLISQLDQEQMLLVKVHVPQVELLGSLDTLQKSNRVEVLAIDGSVTALPESEALPQVMLQTDVAARAKVSAVMPAPELREQLGRDQQNVLVVNGSADQIRATLTNLAAQPGVAIEPAPAELDAVRTRWMMQSSRFELRDRTTGDVEHFDMGEDQRRDAGTQSAKTQEVAQQQVSQSPERTRQSVENKIMSMVYIYFRLQPDTTTPAAQPDHR